MQPPTFSDACCAFQMMILALALCYKKIKIKVSFSSIILYVTFK